MQSRGCCYSWPKSSSTALMIVTVPGCKDWPWRSSSCTSRGKHGASCVHSWAACRHPSEENQPQAQQTPHQIQRALIAGSYRWDKAMRGGRGNLTLEATWICFQFLMMLKAKDNLTVENVYRELGLWQHMSTVATTTVSVDHTRNMNWTMFIPPSSFGFSVLIFLANGAISESSLLGATETFLCATMEIKIFS